MPLTWAWRNAMSFGSVIVVSLGGSVKRPVTGATLDVLGVSLAAVDVAVSHGFVRRVAIDAVQLPLAERELADGLIVLVQTGRLGSTRRRQIGALVEGHTRQVVVSAIVAVIALLVGDGGGQAMPAGVAGLRTRSGGIAALVQPIIVVGHVAGRAAGAPIEIGLRYRLGGEMTAEAVRSKLSERPQDRTDP